MSTPVSGSERSGNMREYGDPTDYTRNFGAWFHSASENQQQKIRELVDETAKLQEQAWQSEKEQQEAIDELTSTLFEFDVPTLETILENAKADNESEVIIKTISEVLKYKMK